MCFDYETMDPSEEREHLMESFYDASIDDIFFDNFFDTDMSILDSPTDFDEYHEGMDDIPDWGE